MNPEAKEIVSRTNHVLIYLYHPIGAKRSYWTLAGSDEPADWIGGNYRTLGHARRVAERFNVPITLC